MTKSEYEKAVRDAARARCSVCGKRVGIEDLCSDGQYIHIGCLRQNQTQPAAK